MEELLELELVEELLELEEPHPSSPQLLEEELDDVELEEEELLDSVVHVALQPSPLVALPSSHCSGEVRMLSPHTGINEQMLGSLVHWKPDSIAQMLLQPSPLVALLSSQVSVPSMSPLPHV